MRKRYSLQKWFPMVLIIIKYCSGTCNYLGDRCTSQNFMHIGKGRKNFGRVSWEKPTRRYTKPSESQKQLLEGHLKIGILAKTECMDAMKWTVALLKQWAE